MISNLVEVLEGKHLIELKSQGVSTHTGVVEHEDPESYVLICYLSNEIHFSFNSVTLSLHLLLTLPISVLQMVELFFLL